MYVHSLLPDKIRLKAELESLLSWVVLDNPPMPRDLGVYLELISLCEINLVVRVGLTVGERVLPGEITLGLELPVDGPIFVFKVSVIFESFSVWIDLTLGQPQCAHNRAEHEMLTGRRDYFFGKVWWSFLILFNSSPKLDIFANEWVLNLCQIIWIFPDQLRLNAKIRSKTLVIPLINVLIFQVFNCTQAIFWIIIGAEASVAIWFRQYNYFVHFTETWK